MGLASLCFNGYNDAMAKDPAPSTPFRIDAEELSWVEITDNGRRLCLRLRDRVGHPASVSIPVDSVNAILTAVPRSADELLQGGATEIYKLDGWSLGWNAGRAGSDPSIAGRRKNRLCRQAVADRGNSQPGGPTARPTG